MRAEVLTVSLVGYTNAGKSTLFNALTHAQTYAADQLFATLDTTSRKLWVGGAGHVVISDTVGFIRDLPHELVAAFHATLEATSQADLLLHVVDSASTVREEQKEEVEKVLAEVGARDVRQIVVHNKLDLTELPPAVERDEYGRITRIRLSARRGDGLDLLRGALAELALEKRAGGDRPEAADLVPEAGSVSTS
jgi:GTP-binding protein HflX